LGADPHLYQATPSDARRIHRADLVVVNGLGLEGWIDDLVQGSSGRIIVDASARVSSRRAEGVGEAYDPHYWFDVEAWSRAASEVADALVQVAIDTGHADAVDTIRQNHERYSAELAQLDGWVRAQVQSIPDGQRVLVTGHDAFAYFGAAYGLEVVGIQGVSTVAEASQRDLVEAIETVRRYQVSAVFMETSVPPALVRQLGRETGARVLGPLYSDSLGASGTPGDTYIGMVVENVTIIVEGLGGAVETWPPATATSAQEHVDARTVPR